MGCLNVIIDSDIIFLLVSILKPHYFNLLKTTLKWQIFISQEIEEEVVDRVSSSLKEKLLKEGVWKYFSPSDPPQEKAIMRKYKDLRKIIHKGEASCYAIAYCAGFSVLSHDHEANRLLPPEIREKVKWYSFYEMIYLLNTEQRRAAEEGLNDDELALFDLLFKEDISKADRERLKQASKALLASLRELLRPMHDWTQNTATQAEVKVFILDNL